MRYRQNTKGDILYGPPVTPGRDGQQSVRDGERRQSLLNALEICSETNRKKEIREF